MDKTLTLIMAATVVTLTGLLLISMAGDSIVDFRESTGHKKENSVCSFQCQTADSALDLNRKCNCPNRKELLADTFEEKLRS